MSAPSFELNCFVSRGETPRTPFPLNIRILGCSSFGVHRLLSQIASLAKRKPWTNFLQIFEFYGNRLLSVPPFALICLVSRVEFVRSPSLLKYSNVRGLRLLIALPFELNCFVSQCGNPLTHIPSKYSNFRGLRLLSAPPFELNCFAS